MSPWHRMAPSLVTSLLWAPVATSLTSVGLKGLGTKNEGTSDWRGHSLSVTAPSFLWRYCHFEIGPSEPPTKSLAHRLNPTARRFQKWPERVMG